MKKVYRFFAAALALSFCAAACQQENLEPSAPQEESTGALFTVNASMADQTKATLTDGESIKWVLNETVAAWSIDKDGNVGHLKDNLLETSTVSSVDETSTTASFTFTNLPQGGKTWIAVGSNTGHDQLSAKKVEFGFPAAMTQSKAGTINPSMIKLVGAEAIDVPVLEEGVETVTLDAKMNLVGTLMRFLVYSKTGIYKAEKVQSVQLVSVDNYIAGTGSAAMAYNLVDGGYRQNNEDAATSGADCVLYWDVTSKAITTTLDEPLSLDGVTEAKEGTGIYMSVPPVKVGGYKYIVTTDVARYTFDASTSALTFGDKTLKNVLLNLENENVARLELADFKGYIYYEGAPKAAETISYESGYINSIGYTVAWVSDSDGKNWVKYEEKNRDEYLYDATFTYYDVNGNVVLPENSWLKVDFSENNICHWSLTYEGNEMTEPRTLKVKGVMNAPEGYLFATTQTDLTEKSYEYDVIVTQAGYSNIKEIKFWGGVDDFIIDATAQSTRWSYWVMQVNSQDYTSYNEAECQMLYKKGTFVCYDYTNNQQGDVVDWLSVEYQRDDNDNVNDTWWVITANENPNLTERKALVVYTMEAPEGYVFKFEDGSTSTTYVKSEIVTQKANIVIKAILENPYTANVTSAGDDITAAKLVLTVNDEAVNDVAAAMTNYGITLTATGGATIKNIAADGTITMTIPENLYANGGKTYTLKVNYDGAVIASTEISQEEGSEAYEAPTWGYTITWCAWGEDVSLMAFNKNAAATYRFLWINNLTKNGTSVTGSLTDEEYESLRSQLIKVVELNGTIVEDDFMLINIGASGSEYYFDCGTADNTTGAALETRWQICNADGSVYRELTMHVNP